MNWCFAIINNRLVEVYFENKHGKIKYLGHCYVNESEYKTKKEKDYIKDDTAQIKLIYRNGLYKKKVVI